MSNTNTYDMAMARATELLEGIGSHITDPEDRRQVARAILKLKRIHPKGDRRTLAEKWLIPAEFARAVGPPIKVNAIPAPGRGMCHVHVEASDLELAALLCECLALVAGTRECGLLTTPEGEWTYWIDGSMKTVDSRLQLIRMITEEAWEKLTTELKVRLNRATAAEQLRPGGIPADWVVTGSQRQPETDEMPALDEEDR